MKVVNKNHKGATEFADEINNYLKKEIKLGATLGPFTKSPFEHLHCPY